MDYINVSPQYFSLLKREEKRGQFTIYNGGSSTEVTYISFNLNQGSRNSKPLVNPIKSRWFNTVEFRQAIAYGIDRLGLLNNIYGKARTLAHLPIAALAAGPLADGLFNPLMSSDGLLAASVGQIIGVGPGRGIGLLFIILGTAIVLTTVVAYLYPPLRLLEDELPDVIPDEVPTIAEEALVAG